MQNLLTLTFQFKENFIQLVLSRPFTHLVIAHMDCVPIPVLQYLFSFLLINLYMMTHHSVSTYPSCIIFLFLELSYPLSQSSVFHTLTLLSQRKAANYICWPIFLNLFNNLWWSRRTVAKVSLKTFLLDQCQSITYALQKNTQGQKCSLLCFLLMNIFRLAGRIFMWMKCAVSNIKLTSSINCCEQF